MIAAVLGVALLSASAAIAQDMRSGSSLAGVAWPVSSYDWADDLGGPRQTILEAAAGVAGGQCGAAREFNAWNMVGEEDPEQFRDSVLASYGDAGWTLTHPDAATPDVILAKRNSDTIAIWLNLDLDRHALSLFTCLIGGTEASAPETTAGRGAGALPFVGEFGLGALFVA